MLNSNGPRHEPWGSPDLCKTILRVLHSRRRDMNGFSGTSQAIVEQCCPDRVSNLSCLANVRSEQCQTLHLGQAWLVKLPVIDSCSEEYHYGPLVTLFQYYNTSCMMTLDQDRGCCSRGVLLIGQWPLIQPILRYNTGYLLGEGCYMQTRVRIFSETEWQKLLSKSQHNDQFVKTGLTLWL